MKKKISELEKQFGIDIYNIEKYSWQSPYSMSFEISKPVEGEFRTCRTYKVVVRRSETAEDALNRFFGNDDHDDHEEI